MKKNNKILILGTGSWGTALATVLLNNKQYVKMYGINKNQISDLKKGYNRAFFNNLKLPKKPQEISSNISELMTDVKFLIVAVPSKNFNALISTIKPYVTKDVIIINTIKGLVKNSHETYFEKLTKIFPNNTICSLLGPSFAREVFIKAPTYMNIVTNNKKVVNQIKKLFDNSYCKVIYNSDWKGISLCSALKNALAIILGILDGLGYTNNTKSAFLAMGIKEIAKLLKLFKSNLDTILEVGSIGDIYLTCSDPESRNYKFGQLIGAKGIVKALKLNENTIEGYEVLSTIYDFIKSKNKINDFPIFVTGYKVINNKLSHHKMVETIWNSL